MNFAKMNHDFLRMRKQTTTIRTDCIFQYDLPAFSKYALFFICMVGYTVIVRIFGLFVYNFFGKYFKTTIGQYVYIVNMAFIFSLYISGAICVNVYEMIGHLILLVTGIVWTGKSIYENPNREEQQDVREIALVLNTIHPVRNSTPLGFAYDQV